MEVNLCQFQALKNLDMVNNKNYINSPLYNRQKTKLIIMIMTIINPPKSLLNLHSLKLKQNKSAVKEMSLQENRFKKKESNLVEVAEEAGNNP